MEVLVANALWGEKTYPFQQSYLDTIGKFDGTGGVFPVDFLRDSKAARIGINDWVSKQTRDRIKDLVPEDGVNKDTVLVLTNAIYFKGEWQEMFKGDATKEEDFLGADGKKTPVPMMHNNRMGSAHYAAFNSDWSVFGTPRKSRRVSRERSSRIGCIPMPTALRPWKCPTRGRTCRWW